VVERLATGRQPDGAFLATGGGYVIRNAGWYGNGRQGSRSWLSLDAGHPLGAPYAVDLFALYLWRIAAVDVVEGIARARNPHAPPLDASIRRALGIGNASGIGMVAALVRWPAWLSAFNFVRELTLAFAMTRRGPVDMAKADRLRDLLGRASRYYAEQPAGAVSEVEEPLRLSERLASIERIAAELAQDGTVRGVRPQRPWAAILHEAETLETPELTEQVNSILTEVECDFGDAATELLPQAMAIARATDPRMRLRDLQRIIEQRYGWALALDLSSPEARAHFWYRSEENAENRRGERAVDPGVDKESFVDVAGAVQALYGDLQGAPPDDTVGRFLMTAPAHSHVVSRVQLAAVLPYSEIRGNILARDFLPMDGIRFLLSTFGLEASHPHSTRWVRGVFLQGAPLPDEIASGQGGDWLFPVLAEAGGG
jgi:hypothetical protein